MTLAIPARILADRPRLGHRCGMTDDVFSHETEAALCRRLLGDRAHGLDTLVQDAGE
ncbi:hypothetical protein EV188_11683 [Actinomycetospora succinea]|uniref:Uncharacterized protein n=1 Tax=Actinomycetospora succinea TaxID=663603 RepID=A0A4R6UST9_9PSEU|nr:hypothetical protein EV188_11683 [Actinomycetospora succinea]